MMTHESHANCNSYLPGHRMHWTAWKHASAAHPLAVASIVEHDTSFEIITEDGATFWWRHHNPAGLRDALRDARLPIVASPQWRMIRIDGMWFNCVPVEAELTVCA